MKKNIEQEKIKGPTDETRKDRTIRETAQHNYKRHHNYNTYNMAMMRSTMEN